MKIKELKSILKKFNGKKDAFVVLFKNKTGDTFEIVNIGNNGGHLQISIAKNDNPKYLTYWKER